jgi:5'-3' exonuclease
MFNNNTMSCIFDTNEPTPTFIFIDGSYYTFYRYFSLMTWWKNAFPETPLTDPFQNEVFVEKFRKTFVETLVKMPKSLGINNEVKPIMFVGKDCPRETIWRMQVYPDYKKNRANGPEDGFMGGPFFKMVYKEELFQAAGAKAILKWPTLEADDCIAISVKHVLATYPECKVYIITSDKDYLQLVEPRVKIFDLKYKNIAEQKTSTGNAKADLFCKIVMGDISDGIPSCIKKCGPKTALKCFENPEYFEERLKKENAYDAYERNKKLVDFDNIPENLAKEFIESNIKTSV